jgi:hypothetical protein
LAKYNEYFATTTTNLLPVGFIVPAQLVKQKPET